MAAVSLEPTQVTVSNPGPDAVALILYGEGPSEILLTWRIRSYISEKNLGHKIVDQGVASLGPPP